MANSDISKIITIIYDLLFIGKTTAKQIQLQTDVRRAKKIRKAIEDCDIEKIRNLVLKNQIILADDDIIGISPSKDGIIVTPEMLIKFRQMTAELIRCRRVIKSR